MGTRIQPYNSAALRCFPPPRTHPCSRGALNALHATALPPWGWRTQHAGCPYLPRSPQISRPEAGVLTPLRSSTASSRRGRSRKRTSTRSAPTRPTGPNPRWSRDSGGMVPRCRLPASQTSYKVCSPTRTGPCTLNAVPSSARDRVWRCEGCLAPGPCSPTLRVWWRRYPTLPHLRTKCASWTSPSRASTRTQRDRALAAPRAR